MMALEPPAKPGYALLSILWHEWGHLDVKQRTEGQLINNPKYVLANEKGQDEQWKGYNGGKVLSDTRYDFGNFDEAWNEAITYRRMTEDLGLNSKNKFIYLKTMGKWALIF